MKKQRKKIDITKGIMQQVHSDLDKAIKLMIADEPTPKVMQGFLRQMENEKPIGRVVSIEKKDDMIIANMELYPSTEEHTQRLRRILMGTEVKDLGEQLAPDEYNKVFIDTIHGNWAHMVSGNLENLHLLAKKIGLERRYYEGVRKGHPHYDVPGLRLHDKAIANGAIKVGRKELVRYIKRHFNGKR